MSAFYLPLHPVWPLRWELLQRWFKAEETSQRGVRQYAFLGADMCRAAAARVLGCSGPRVTKWTKWMREGHTEPPEDLRSHQPHMESVEMRAADVLLAWV